MSVIIGVDPGLKGGIAAVDGNTGELLEVISMPTRYMHPRKPRRKPRKTVSGRRKPRKQSGRRVVDVPVLCEFVRKFDVAFAMVERVSARAGEGVVGGFSFGMGYGTVTGALEALGLEVKLVAPQTWKRELGFLNKEKELPALEAEKRWPGHTWRSNRASKDGSYRLLDGKGDAAMIGLYAFKTQGAVVEDDEDDEEDIAA